MDSQTILLVEDDATLRDITAFRLELLGYDVWQVGSAEEAWTELEARQPDLIILDLAISGGEGLQLLEQLSNDQALGRIPVLVFSTSADLEDVQRAYAAGGDDFLVTPYDPANLEGKIEKLLDGVKQAAH